MKPKSGISAREWLVEQRPAATCKALVVKHHYTRSTANTCVASHALIRRKDDRVMGATLWMPPTPTAARSVADDWRSVLVLSRLVVHPEVPKNGASFLLGRSMKLIDGRWRVLLTYADTGLGHSGTIYKATNWSCLGETPAGDVWLDREGRQVGRKRGPRNLTVKEMRDRGFVKKKALPKIKFIYERWPP